MPMNIELKSARRLRGEIEVPGDKSISHRAVLIGSLANGTTEIGGFLRAADPLSTVRCIEDLGIRSEFSSGTLKVYGKGLDGYSIPGKVLDAGNSGTTIRLLTGILAGQNFASEITGDKYLTQRPMKRIIEPLTLMGASVTPTSQYTAPLKILPNGKLKSIRYTLPVASAQVKSSILFAGLFAEGSTTVIESKPTRDHTERMLSLEPHRENGNTVVSITGRHPIQAQQFFVPGDPSSAAFFIVLALITSGSEIAVKNVGMNPTRVGFIHVLKSMGADITVENERIIGGEPIGDIIARSSNLQSNVVLRGEIVPNVIDEIPILAVAGAFAKGTFEVRDASELRAKECDRIRAICANLRTLGIDVEEFEDGFAFEAKKEITSGKFESFDDHRIAMSFGVAGIAVGGKSVMLNAECVDISFPEFWNSIERLMN
jgi:3-phosphoshikimate 1-carboxyvinyltransferase